MTAVSQAMLYQMKQVELMHAHGYKPVPMVFHNGCWESVRNIQQPVQLEDMSADHLTRIKQVFIQARDYLSKPDHWCQHAGSELRPGGVQALCMQSALHRFAHPQDRSVIEKIFIKMSGIVTGCGIPHWNDRPNRTHSDIMRTLGLVIRNTENLVREKARRELMPIEKQPVQEESAFAAFIRKMNTPFKQIEEQRVAEPA